MTTALPRAPFLPFDSFGADEVTAAPPLVHGASTSTRSPFVSVYEVTLGDEGPADGTRDAYAAAMNELHDEEFDEAVFELQCHARALHDSKLAAGMQRQDADRMLAQHFAPFVREAEAMVSRAANHFGPRESAGIIDNEIDTFAEDYTPGQPLAPEFEELFGKLLKKVKGVVKSAAGAAWKGIKKVGLGPILNQIKALIKPLLDKVLKKAIGKLPAAVQPAAQQLAQKLGFAPVAAPVAPVPDASTAVDAGAVQQPAGSDDPSPQQEFNEQIVNAFLAHDEVNLDLELMQHPQTSFEVRGFADLEDARERFIAELQALKEGQSAEPHVQNFLPAVLPALRLGIRLAGRPRVINFLSPLLAKLIANLVGPQMAPALSRAIVDAGLKLLTLETSAADEAEIAASSVAATVEETLTRIAGLPDYVLDNQEMLEGFALEAFERAAAANLPAVFSNATYVKRPELLEAGLNAAWLMLPVRGRKRYKRCTRVFDVRVTPHMAAEIESFEGAPLADYLTDELGVPEGEGVDAKVHLYETLPGTTIADIARSEGEGTAMSNPTHGRLHPLTPQAAAVLLGKPGLGRTLLSNSRNLAAGQRLFSLAVAGRRPMQATGSGAHRRRSLHVGLHLDTVKDEIRACVFISEVKAQKLAVRLRQSTNQGLLVAAFSRAISSRLDRILFGDAGRRLHVIHAGLRPGQSGNTLAKNLPQVVAQALLQQVKGCLANGFAQFLQAQAPRLIAATEDAADGITLRFVIERAPGLKQVCQAMVDRAPAADAIVQALAGATPAVRMDVFPGHNCG